MAKLFEIFSDDKSVYWGFECPGCGCVHHIPVKGQNPGGAEWSFNGDINSPTFSPSILVQWKYKDKDFCCHSFVCDGKIQFLSDCTHSLSGKTVELPNV